MENKENPEIVLYTYFRSSASWRIRTILNLKKLSYTPKFISLLKKEQCSEEYMKLNPACHVPTLEIDDNIITESMAIAEYIEERFPNITPRLLPDNLVDRAHVRQICEHINSGMQPLHNLKVLQTIENELKGDKMAWAHKWNKAGFITLEKILEKTKGKYCVKDNITLADVFLIPQVKSATARFGIDINDYPNVKKVFENLKDIPEFVQAYPENQPDFK